MSNLVQCCLLSPPILQSVKKGLSVKTFYNLSKEQLKVSGNINMVQQFGCGIRNSLDSQLSGSHCIKLSSFPIWLYCGISTLDHGHTISSLLLDGVWPRLHYSFDSKTVKLKPAMHIPATVLYIERVRWGCLWDARNIILGLKKSHFLKISYQFLYIQS